MTQPLPAALVPSAVDPDLDGIERHRPVEEPYPGAPGFVLAHCPVCDGVRWTVRVSRIGALCGVRLWRLVWLSRVLGV